MHVLITGGAGFVGSLLVPELLRSGHTLAVLDSFVFEPRQFDIPMGGLTCFEGDLRDEALVMEALEGVEAVIHLAGISNDPSSDLHPQVALEINLEASCRLVDLSESTGVRRFINASSASVYGLREEEHVTEDLAPRPLTIYARTKALCEEHVLSRNSRQFVTTSVRPATLSGYAPRLRLDLVANIFVQHAVCHGQIRVFGADNYRPNLSVRDMVRAYQMLLEADTHSIGGKTFNLCEGNYTLMEIAERVRKIVGLDKTDIRLMPTDDKRSYRLSSVRAERELGFYPAFDLDDSIREVAAALCDGRIPEPEHMRYRNVEWLRGRDLSFRMLV